MMVEEFKPASAEGASVDINEPLMAEMLDGSVTTDARFEADGTVIPPGSVTAVVEGADTSEPPFDGAKTPPAALQPASGTT